VLQIGVGDQRRVVCKIETIRIMQFVRSGRISVSKEKKMEISALLEELKNK
jgi:hypothetical protein